MNKCDFYPDSELRNGKLVCPFGCCMLTKSEWEKIMKILANKK